MALSEKKKISNKRWTDENYKQVKLSVPNREAELLDAYCVAKSTSKAGFIRAAIKEKMIREPVAGLTDSLTGDRQDLDTPCEDEATDVNK